MKKLFISLWILLCCTFTCVVSAAEVNISDVVTAFNKGSVASGYKESGGSLKAVYDKDSVDVTININNESQNVSYQLNGNIITADIKKTDADAFTKAYLMQELIEVASVLHGYTYGEVTNMINAGVLDSYKISTHGFEQTLDSQGNVVIKVDVSKKIPSASLNDVYLEKTDLENYKEYITGDGYCGKTKGNIYFYMSTNGNMKDIIIAEKGGITENSYMSFMTVIDIMFYGDSEVINKIAFLVPNLTTAVNESGVTVKINESEFSSDVSDYDYLKKNGYSVVLIKIDKERFPVSENITTDDGTTDDSVSDDGTTEGDSNATGEEVSKEEKEETTKTEDNKKENGLLSVLKDNIIIIIGVIVVVLVIVLILINKKGKSSSKLELANGNNGVIQPSMMQVHTTNEVVESLDDIETSPEASFTNNAMSGDVMNQDVVQQPMIQPEQQMMMQDGMYQQPTMQQSQMINQQPMIGQPQVMQQQPVMQSPVMDQSQMIAQPQIMQQSQVNPGVVQQPMMDNQFVNNMNGNNVSFDNNMNNNQNN